MVYFEDNYNFPNLKGGSNIFQGGGGEGGVQLFQVYTLPIPIETYRTFDFLGGGGVRTPVPLLDPRI